MALESERVAEAAEMNPGDRRARSERRGKDRRLGKTRINHVAPRRSLMKALGASATAISCAVLGIVIVATAMISQSTPWIALLVSGMAVVISAFALMLGSLEQRLIEIRLELMMANGGMRQADRRDGDRRSDTRRSEDAVNGTTAGPADSGPVVERTRARRAADQPA